MEVGPPLLRMVIRVEDFGEPCAGPKNLRSVGVDVFATWDVQIANGIVFKHRFIVKHVFFVMRSAGVVVKKGMIEFVVGGRMLSGRGDGLEQFKPSCTQSPWVIHVTQYRCLTIEPSVAQRALAIEGGRDAGP